MKPASRVGITSVTEAKDDIMKKILAVRGQQAQDILGLLKCVATGGGKFPLHEVHEQTMHAFAEHLFHTTVQPRSTQITNPPIYPNTSNSSLRSLYQLYSSWALLAL